MIQIRSFVKILLQVMLGGLMLHFFAHTVVSYGVGLDLPILWLWKE
jgi:hypothetical protein